jgi:bromodomain adjacent to zinc finger domain protein 1A
LKVEYRVEAIDDDKQPQTWTVKGESLRRDKTVFTKEKTKLFLKQQVEGANSMLKVKDESIQKYVTERGLKMEELFVGKLPDFEVSKKLLLQKEKEKTTKKAVKADKATTSTKSKKSGGGGKQGDITKYLNNSGKEGSKQLSAEEKKKREENSKKFREELEAKKKEKADLEAEKAKKAAEEKARILAKVQATVREHNQTRDDLELIDQRVIPKGKLISTLVDEKYFADFIKILEFLHSFPEVLSISDKFPYGITIEIFERALLMKEVNGPLSDIIQVLLGTIFTLQVEEENEMETEYRINGDVPVKHSKVDQMKNASRVHIWASQHYSTKINEMVMDSTTISELLRLHLMGSGAIVSERTSKYRFAARGGYKSQDDPGLILASKYPHIIKFLSQYSVFQLPTKDILRVLGCLTDQILTYSNLREVLEERLEQSVSAKLEYRSLKASEGRRERKVIEEKKALQEEHKTIIAGYAEEKPEKKDKLVKEAEEELEQKIVRIDAHSVKERAQHLKELKAQVSIFFNHQTFLGSDRAFRNYYIFESVPGLFVEHDITFAGKCIGQYVKNNPALAHCTKEQRYAIIKQMVTTEEAGASDDKENKAEINGAATDKSATNGKKESDTEMQKDLYMCNCDPATCIVHSDTPERNSWTYFHTAEEIDSLIESLNSRGYREKGLRETLEANRDLIIDYIKDCPIQKLSVMMDDDEKVDEMKKIARRMTTKKYENANLNREAGTDANEIYDLTMREILLDFEQKVTLGCLGNLKVQDRMLWRKYIEDIEYYALDDNLNWGNARKLLNGLSNGHAKENGSVHGSEATEDDTASSVGDLDPAHTFDSGNCSDMESDDGDGAKMKTSEMEAVKLKVKNLAMALLQIEQGIDIKFIRAPFGPTKELKDKDAMAKAMETCKKKILKWEESLMKSTSYAQVFLHYNILHDSILWSRSAQRVGCMICRRKNDPEQTLLCDECNKGWHMFCLKPKLTQIPQGDWFCPRCRPDDYKPKTTRKRKVFVEEEVESEEEEEITADESTVR